MLNVTLGNPLEKGIEKRDPNPELLFAGAYSACYHGALVNAAKKGQKIGVELFLVRGGQAVGRAGIYLQGRVLDEFRGGQTGRGRDGRGRCNDNRWMPEKAFEIPNCPNSTATRD